MLNKLFRKHLDTIFYSFLIILFAYIIYSPISTQADSEGYLDMAFYRSLSYPVFLNILRTLFGSFFLISIKISQGLLGVSAIYFFIKTLQKSTKMSPLFLLISMILITSPYFYLTKPANYILSEGIAYPLYLITISHIISYYLREKEKSFIYSIIFLFILIETRSQFVFIIPVLLLVIVHNSVKNKSFIKNKYYFLSLLILPILTSLVDKTYHKLKHDHFVNTPWSGIHIVSPAFYVSQKSDITIYKTKLEQDYFRETFNQLSKSNLLYDQAEEQGESVISHYTQNFSKIANHTVLPVGENIIFKEKSKSDKLIAIDQLTKKMTLPLLLKNFNKWAIVYVKNYVNAFGSIKSLLPYIFLMIFGLFSLRKDETVFKFICLTMFLTLINIAIISLGMHTIKRFTFYNDWTLIVTMLLIFDFIRKKKKENLS